ncbi:16S rRNA (guanine(527)-N(7))-methyltransferase RsmG [Sphingomonas sp. MMS24-JH45]
MGRHIVDFAQLGRFADRNARTCIHIGSGAGFPGLIIAMLFDGIAMVLVEPRRRRAEFLMTAVQTLGVRSVTVQQVRSQQIPPRSYDVISARAVAALPELLTITAHLRSPETRYLLPKGRSGVARAETLPPKWQGLFHVEQIITDPQSSILVGTGVT